MKTITIQIGNTDNKLTQQEWSDYVREVDRIVRLYMEIHFSGGSPTEAAWQNYCWVGASSRDAADLLGFRDELNQTRRVFNQDSVAVTVGETQFV